MSRIAKYFIFFFMGGAAAAQAQKYGIPDDPALFPDSLKTILTNTRVESLIEVADKIPAAWPALDGVQQQKVIEQVKMMHEMGYKARPHLAAYFKALCHGLLTENMDAQHTTDYLNMTGSVIEGSDEITMVQYLKRMATFFEHHALFYANSNKLFISEESYGFKYIAPAAFEEEIPVEDTYEEDNWEEDDDWEEEEDWEEDDGWGTEWSDDDYEEDTGLDEIAAITGGNILPVIEGPVIHFTSAGLNFSTPYDSVFLYKTSGDFLVNSLDFVGTGGQFDWTMAGLGKDSVFVNFDTYSFKVNKPRLKAESTKLTYKGKVEGQVDGAFSFASTRHDSTTDATYPRFESYYADIKMKDLGDLIYTGGFTLRGSNISSGSLLGGLSRIEALGETGKKFKARAKIFDFGDSAISTERASVVIYHGNDSIYHPSLRLNYEYGKKYLILQKDKGGFRNTPFTSTFFNVDFTADIVRWDLEADSLDASILEARRIVPAIIESADHYNFEDYRALGDKIYPFNPLSMVVYYSNMEALDEFYVSDLARHYKKDPGVMKGAMAYLSQKGLIGFDPKNDRVTVKQKAHHLYEAKAGRKDYDNMILASVTHTKPNITLNFKNSEMRVRGVEQFKLSDSLNVTVTPDSSEITLMNNRDFNFNGKIRAGNFEYIGRNFTFVYDSFLINLNQIDSVQFYVKEENSRGTGATRKVDNSLLSEVPPEEGADPNMQSSGTLYINKPGNKSGQAQTGNFPKFNSKSGSVVYFDRDEVLSGAYDKSVYFKVPPFDLDSLGDSDVAAIGFEGTFISSGIFPEFKETLEIMPDYSMGFNHDVPEEGYELYNGDGVLYNDLTLDRNGLTSNGTIDFLAASVVSDNFTFYPDSVIAIGSTAEIREESYGSVDFPQASISNYSLKWLPKKDSMYISNLGAPIDFYNKTASLDGSVIVSKSGVYGSGELRTRGSVSQSKQLTFENDRYMARHAQFELESNDPEKPALYGDDVRLNFDLDDNYAIIGPEVEGEAAIEFPYAKFKTSITRAKWDLTNQKITMAKPDNVPLESSYFYTTREDLDSLRFNATQATYDITSQELKVSGIPYIVVADAKITPENNEVLILENSRIGRLTNTTIILDTLNGYHRLVNGVIDIISRNEFTGYATYNFVNALNDTVPIKMENFHLDSTALSSKRNAKYEYHTIANGSVSESQNILMSPGMLYKGDMLLYAHKPSMQLDGYVKLDLDRPGYNTWIQHQSTGDEKQVVINYERSLTEDGRKLNAGIFYSAGDNGLYALFIDETLTPDDEQFFSPSGVLFYDEVKKEYVIQDSLKASGKKLAGKIFRYSDDTGDIQFEGAANFLRSTDDATFDASVIGTGNMENNEYTMNSMLTVDFTPVPSQAYDIMAMDIIDVVTNLGAPEGLGDPTQLLYKLADLAGERAAREYESRSLEEYTPLAGFARETTVPLVFSNIDIKYSADHFAFYSEGKLGLSNINNHDINGAFDGFLEIKKNEAGGPVFNLFIKASPASWFFYSYEDDRLLIYSSNNNFNTVVSKKSNGSKAKLGELIFAPASRAEVLDFINRFRLDYYGIDDMYQLDSDVENVTEDLPDDGFGASEDDGFGDEEDDGF